MFSAGNVTDESGHQGYTVALESVHYFVVLHLEQLQLFLTIDKSLW